MLLACLGVYLVLQLRAFYWVYEVFSPLQAIDFPYRMLAFITPIGVILVVSIANCAVQAYPDSLGPKLVAVAWMLSLVALSPLTSTWTVNYGTFLDAPPGHFPSLAFSAPPKYVDYQTYRGLFTFDGVLFDEYLPKVFYSGGQELFDDVPLFARLHDDQHGAASLSKVPCTVGVPTRSPLETLSLTFTVKCGGATRLALPVSYNAFSSVFVEDKGKTLSEIPYSRASTDPRMIIDVPSSKPEVVVVHLPTLWGTLK